MIKEKDKEYIKELLEKYNDSPKFQSETSTAINDAINEFNENLHSGKYPAGECYQHLYEQKNKIEHDFYKKHGFHMNMDYAFLYPERLDLTDILDKLKK